VNRIANALGNEVTSALPALHAFTGCDTVRAFVGKGKVRPLKLMQGSTKNIQTFKQLGVVADTLPSDVMEGLENFVCYLYGSPKANSTSAVRYQLFQSWFGAMATEMFPSGCMSGIDISLLPPCRSALKWHCLRANYQTFIWTHSHIRDPALPLQTTCGWKLGDDKKLEIEWNTDSIMPQALIDILEEQSATGEADLEADINEVEEDDVVDNIIDVIFQPDEAEIEVCLRCRRQLSL